MTILYCFPWCASERSSSKSEMLSFEKPTEKYPQRSTHDRWHQMWRSTANTKFKGRHPRWLQQCALIDFVLCISLSRCSWISGLSKQSRLRAPQSTGFTKPSPSEPSTVVLLWATFDKFTCTQCSATISYYTSQRARSVFGLTRLLLLLFQ